MIQFLSGKGEKGSCIILNWKVVYQFENQLGSGNLLDIIG